jgi:hypothetical protein
MTARDVADRCLQDTGAGTLSGKAGEVALIAIACATPDKRKWRKQIATNYKTRHPECGSIFLIFVLPLLISLISNWLARWIFSEPASTLAAMKAEALNALD